MKEKILELRRKGLSYKAISKELGCSKGTISYHCSKLIDNDEKIKQNNEIKNTKQKKISSFLLQTDKIDEVLNLRKEKKTYNEIREITGLSKHIISKIAREYNLLQTRKYGSINDEIIIKIRELYLELKSTRKVAKALSLSRDSISKYVQDLMNKKVLTEKERKKSQSNGVVSWRKRKKIELVEYKGGKCEKCGYNKCVKALSFHHLDPKEKDFHISGRSWSVERLKKEVDKCILVCMNCHTEIHAEIEENKILASIDLS